MNWTDTRAKLIDLGQSPDLPLEWKFRIDLRGANLRGANLCEANLRVADLGVANLYEANLRMADLSEANLRMADLREADLSEADLREADLRGANLHGADLHGADLRGALWNYITLGFAPASEGTLIAWAKKSSHILKFLISEDVPRSCATTRKHRSASVVVLEIDGGTVDSFIHRTQYGDVTYTVGQVTEADGWDEDRWNECSHGIHWFLSRHEAEQWS